MTALKTLTPIATGRLLAALLWLALLGGCTHATNTPSAHTLRVMTYNIHHGEGLDGRVDLPRIAQVIKDAQADIVALQEVDRGVERTQGRDLPAELAALTGMTCVFSNNYHHQGGEYGNAVLTRFPVVRWTNQHYRKVNENEQRGLLQLTLQIQGQKVQFWNTHIDYRPNDAARWSNLDEIESLAARHRGTPIILCGDFNDTPESRVVRRLSNTFLDTWLLVGEGDGHTIPANNPRKRIDYIWLSKESPFVPVKAWVPRTEGSDHLPVVVELQWR